VAKPQPPEANGGLAVEAEPSALSGVVESILHLRANHFCTIINKNCVGLVSNKHIFYFSKTKIVLTLEPRN